MGLINKDNFNRGAKDNLIQGMQDYLQVMKESERKKKREEKARFEDFKKVSENLDLDNNNLGKFEYE